MIRFHRLAVFVITLGMLLSACALETEPPTPPDPKPASNLVINEVFTLPISHPAAYSWIEFYNPTADTINLTNWSLSYTTFRVNTTITVSIDTTGAFQSFLFTSVIDSFGMYDVPFGEGVFDIPGVEEDTVKLPPGELFTIVTDEDRLLDHTNWGPADERFHRERSFFQGPIDGFAVIDSTDTLITIQATAKGYGFYLQQTDQIVLKDTAGNVVDVVRYGNYVYPGPGTDPYLNNHSVGIIPDFESIQRYAGAYWTGNTLNDFYTSSSTSAPTPHWFSLLHKDP